jgi:hypothetical protein
MKMSGDIELGWKTAVAAVISMAIIISLVVWRAYEFT